MNSLGLCALIHRRQQRAFKILRKVSRVGAGGRIEEGPGAEHQRDGQARNRRPPEPAHPQDQIAAARRAPPATPSRASQTRTARRRPADSRGRRRSISFAVQRGSYAPDLSDAGLAVLGLQDTVLVFRQFGQNFSHFGACPERAHLHQRHRPAGQRGNFLDRPVFNFQQRDDQPRRG